MARKPKVQARLPPDVKEDLDEYQEARNITQSTATRRLIEAGLDAEPTEPPEEETAEYDTELHQDMGAVQLAGGAVIAVLVAVLLVAAQPVAAVAAVAAAAGGAVGGSVR